MVGQSELQQYYIDHRKLLTDLRKSGVAGKDIWDWVNNRLPMPQEAVPVLVRHLAEASSERLVEGIARALTEKRNAVAVGPLLARFERTADDHVRWAIANAIAYIGFKGSDGQVVLRLAADPSFGRSRQNLVAKLHNVRSPDVESILLRLLDDPDVDAFAADSLTYCGGSAALARLSQLDLATRSPIMRRNVSKAIRRITVRLAKAGPARAV